MAERQIWVVYGQTGEYSDHSEWTVAAYTTEEEANKHARLATEWYKAAGATELRRDYEGKSKNPHDPFMRVDYTGTEWGVYPCILREAVPNE